MVVTTEASGGIPVTVVTEGGLLVYEAPAGHGIPVTQVASGGIPVTYDS